MPMTPTSPTRRAPRPPLRALATAAAASTLVVLTTLVVLAGSAAAQSPTTSTPPVTTPVENPGSTAAGFVFFGVTGAIIVGALLLYLRNRRPRVPSEP